MRYKADTIRQGCQDTRDNKIGLRARLRVHVKYLEESSRADKIEWKERGGGKLAVFNPEGEQRYNPTTQQLAC